MDTVDRQGSWCCLLYAQHVCVCVCVCVTLHSRENQVFNNILCSKTICHPSPHWWQFERASQSCNHLANASEVASTEVNPTGQCVSPDVAKTATKLAVAVLATLTSDFDFQHGPSYWCSTIIIALKCGFCTVSIGRTVTQMYRSICLVLTIWRGIMNMYVMARFQNGARSLPSFSFSLPLLSSPPLEVGPLQSC